MTMPPEAITVQCPKFGKLYKDGYRGSLNLDLDVFDEEYIREAYNTELSFSCKSWC